ncbi:MAG TPA: hypothetical protein VH087_14440, partial [Thermoanaerobaculia bacterium]|nr:hypothetical protein [Thermoanaerobaculia bacterium]
MLAFLFLAQYASAGDPAITHRQIAASALSARAGDAAIVRREPALSPTTVRTDSGVAQLESEFLRVAIPIADGGLRT